MNKLRLVSVLTALLAVLLVAGVAGATPLPGGGPFQDTTGEGLSIAVGGVGLEPGVSGSATITMDIGGPVQEAFLYWTGINSGCGSPLCPLPTGSNTFLTFDGNPITSNSIGTEANGIGFRADVTSAVQAKAPGNGLQFNIEVASTSDLTEVNGAGLFVIFTDSSDSADYRVQVFDGLDFAWDPDPRGFPAFQVTDPVTFIYTPTNAARDAELVIFASDAVSGRPDRIDISDNPSQFDQLDGDEGAEWDVDVFNISIPANVGATTVQLFSAPADQNPDSLLWILGALRIPLPQAAQGCTPGYWKNHESQWPADDDGQILPGDTDFTVDPDTFLLADLFGDAFNTFEKAVNAKGGGPAKLARHGVSAILNALDPDVAYPLTLEEVIDAIESGDANTLGANNELGCPL